MKKLFAALTVLTLGLRDRRSHGSGQRVQDLPVPSANQNEGAEQLKPALL